MAKGGKKQKEAASAGQDAVLDLRMDSSTPEAPREVAAEDSGGFQTPCTITGVMAGLSGGTLGYVFGFGGYWMRHMRGGGQWKPSLAEGWGSAKTFGIMGGLYAAVSCFMQRLRQKNDAWNGAASGCATGLALGWKQGPLSALQSCAMLGAFSFFVDGMGVNQAAAAAAESPAGASAEPRGGGGSGGSSGSSGSQWWQVPHHHPRQQRSALELLLSPAVPLLAAMAPCAFGAPEGGPPGSSAPAGCRVVRRRR
ncbi:hypothetical protein CHLNCDRAFT_58549 [Chlorella variabilis]|uniref:Mitochondrial import inner membrane translocase subunit TIM22 n=1 Tax=Chlorella variabilis TaxID=554065 RepID=E1ZL36_CHLVA|nr:hypothetical protein CHLNCDRAFT_58549 [Chlorella variabilis]EFN53590.1 hypothetical protein CHLNCDRAFT_58549 [Chlorella variabilis]|eukprot:XP_005845692.1 hypothetical protein CHLNCDRAFT_58549 [Chlorella variabilis]